MTHIVLRFSKPVTVRGELVEPLVPRQHWPSTSSGRTASCHFGASICYVREVDTHYPEFPLPASE
ncbi:hypothetical protein [Candidatus Nitrotoga arctica]|uniref:hypothetical protein n=1 Tax=Candidatus Nitrotoga arctica TaxID=453162 RepID=UPI001EFBD099|nr:hypothetical protein [Candidatus Nitrotoga arctica]